MRVRDCVCRIYVPSTLIVSPVCGASASRLVGDTEDVTLLPADSTVTPHPAPNTLSACPSVPRSSFILLIYSVCASLDIREQLSISGMRNTAEMLDYAPLGICVTTPLFGGNRDPANPRTGCVPI